MTRRFLSTDLELKSGVRLSPPESIANHLANVLRLQPDDEVELSDGRGQTCLATVVTNKPVVLELHEVQVVPRQTELTLIVALIKSDRWSWMLEKVTEIGVSRIVPLMCSRSVVKIPSDKVEERLKRWRKICESAARQSGQNYVPELDVPCSFSEARQFDLHHVYGSPTQSSSVDLGNPIGLWIGPEGGFDEDELELLSDFADPWRFSKHLLRAETAAIVGSGLVLSG